MAVAADRAGIHFRTLNASKGPAVRATRAQADRVAVPAGRARPARRPAQPAALPAGRGGPRSWRATGSPASSPSPACASTPGRWCSPSAPSWPGRIHVGLTSYSGGRAGDPASIGLAARLRELPFDVGRLKTGTPPRIDARSVDFSVMTVQHGDTPRARLLLPGPPRRSSPPGALPPHPHHRRDPRADPERAGPLADVHGRHRGRGPPLLPVGGRQDRPLRRQGLPPDLRGARGPRLHRAVPQRHLHQPALRRAAGLRAHDPRFREAPTSRGRATPSSTTTSTRAASRPRWRPRACRASGSPARSTAPRATRRPRPRA